MYDTKQELIDQKEKEAREKLCEAMYTIIGKSERGEISFCDMRGEIELVATLERLLRKEIYTEI